MTLSRSDPVPFPLFPLTQTLSSGLYYKLHGTHRPNSMKKTVIKRRKRVPAASGASASTNTSPTSNTRLTEQAAAEALVSVSRAQERASGEESDGAGAEDDDDEDEDEPRRKRIKRAANGNPPASLTRRRSARTKVSTREPTPEDKDEVDDDADTGSKRRKKGSQRDILLAESRAGSLSRSSSRAAFHIDRYGRGYTANSPSLHSTSHVGGFDLPPLNAALAAPEMSHMVLNGSRAFFPTSAGYVGPSRDFGSSYMRSGSAAPSRAHSPSNAYVLPPLHYASNSGIYGNGSPHHRSSPSSPSIPSHAELEKHFMDLSKEKSRLEEMLARTEWLMQGVRRGMDEMRERELAIALSQHAAQRSRQPTPRPVSASPPRSPRQGEERPSSQPPASIPLQRHRAEPSPIAKETVWNVVPIETSV